MVRRNASDKLKLIEMVHNNPILWDSRLPNFKGAEQEKNLAWEHIGREFNAPGRRVARAFKSLRESYRRELAHVKIMGNGFKPKWTLYEAMDFLRDVIRERKGGSHASDSTSSAPTAMGINLNMNGAYTAAAASHHNSNSSSGSKHSLKPNSIHSAFDDSALNLSKCSSHMSHEDFFYAFVKPELQLGMQQQHHINANANMSNCSTNSHQQQQMQPLPAHLQSQQQHALQLQQQLKREFSQNNDSRVSSTRNDSNAQHSNFDDAEMRSGDEASVANVAISHQDSDEVEELEAIDADFPYPLILDSNSSPINSADSVVNSVSASVNNVKRKHKELMNGGNSATGDGMEEDEDNYENEMMQQQQRHMRQHNGQLNFMNGLAGLGAGLPNGVFVDMPQPQSVREVLNSKFCSFITAKLNSMQDAEADNLITKILLLLVQTQQTSSTTPTETKL